EPGAACPSGQRSRERSRRTKGGSEDYSIGRVAALQFSDVGRRLRGSATRLTAQSIRACVVPKAAPDAWLSTLEVLQFRRVRTRVFRPSHAANSRGVGPERAENGMQCDSCGKPATVHLTDVSNNSKQELHLCEDCANAQ